MEENKQIEKPVEEKEQVSSVSMVESAHIAASKLKEQNERMEKNIARLEELKAFETLGGKSEGAPQEKKPAEETPKEYSKRIMSGKV